MPATAIQSDPAAVVREVARLAGAPAARLLAAAVSAALGVLPEEVAPGVLGLDPEACAAWRREGPRADAVRDLVASVRAEPSADWRVSWDGTRMVRLLELAAEPEREPEPDSDLKRADR